jgi:hypothetical protein
MPDKPPIMNPSTPPSLAGRNWVLSLLVLTLALGSLLFGLIVYGITSYVRLGSDERALRNGLLKAAAAPWEKKLEVNVGTWTVGLAQIGLLFARLEPRAKTALRCIRAGEVGIYQFNEHGGRINRPAMLSAADKAMDGRGWDRLVGVVNSEDLVAVYVPRNLPSATDLKVCVAVIDDGRLILASARSNLDPLIELIRDHPEWRLNHHLPAELWAVVK